MNLTSITLKNIKYNIKNYTAYLLESSFVICILFMFFSLICSKNFMKAINTFEIKGDLINAVIIMTVFSTAFILYTTVSFTKYRGKEFGVYFTIGLTSKNIIKILFYENIIISAAAFVFGAVFGSLFSKLFYMAIIKILKLNNISISINLAAYGYIAVIAALIFAFNTIYQIIFLKGSSIVNILKADSKMLKSDKLNSVLGIAAIVIIIISMICFQRAANDQVIYNSRYGMKMMIVCIAAAIISMYFVIGFIMILTVKLSKYFKWFYNNNILVLNSLLHRFTVYRGVLFIVTLLVAGSVTFVSIVYSVYRSTEKYINNSYPYDLSFVAGNDQKNEDFESIIKTVGVDINSYNMLECIEVPELKVTGNHVIWDNFQIAVTSESSYKKLTKKNIRIEQGHAVLAEYDTTGGNLDSGIIIDIPDSDDELQRLSTFNFGMATLEDYKRMKGNHEYLYVPKQNKIIKSNNISNLLMSRDYFRGRSIIVNDEDYRKLKARCINNSICYDVLVDFNNRGNYETIEKKLKETLGRIKSNKSIMKSLVIKQEKLKFQISNRGFELFVYSFLGIMLLLGSAAVLCFKVFTSLEEDRNRTRQLIKLGLTDKEINILFIKELGIVFLVPPLIAVVSVGYFLSRFYINIPDGSYIWSNSMFVFGLYGVIQTVFFIITANKYLEEIKL